MAYQIGQQRVNAWAFAAAAIAVFSCAPALANTQVKDALNTADMNFRVGNNDMGCIMVDLAISSANTPDIYGVNTVSRSEIARYAKRCGLRY